LRRSTLCSSRVLKIPSSTTPLSLACSTSRYVPIFHLLLHTSATASDLRSQGKAKHAKWAEYKDLSAEDAQKKYVEAVKKLVAQYK